MTGQQLKNSILQMAVQGKLVPQDPNDEPASVLLERIRKEKEQLIKEGKIKKEKNPSYIFRGADNLPYEKVGKNEPVCIADEVSFEIPDTWEWVRLGSIGDWGSGATPSRSIPEYYGGDIPWLKTGDLNDGYIEYIPENISRLALEKTSVRLNPAGSVLIAMYGATIGKLGILTFPATTNQACCACLPIEICNEYLFYFLMSQKVAFVKQSEGGAQPNISKEKIVATLMPLPSLAEQYRIVAKIKEVLPYIERYGEACSTVNSLNKAFPDLLKKSILQEAVQGKLVPQDPVDEPATVLLERIRAEKEQLIKAGKIKRDKHESVIFRRDNSHYEKLDGIERCIDDEIPFEIPANWEWARLGMISTYSQTKQKINVQNADSNMWGLDLEDIEKGGKLLDIKTVGERKAVGEKNLFYRGDILYSKLRPYLLKILVAPGCGICTPEIVPFKVFGSLEPEYIVAFLKCPYVDAFINAVTYGVKMPRVSTETMTNLLVPIPPLSEQRRIVEKQQELFDKITLI